jgi:hypothetical protein
LFNIYYSFLDLFWTVLHDDFFGMGMVIKVVCLGTEVVAIGIVLAVGFHGSAAAEQQH